MAINTKAVYEELKANKDNLVFSIKLDIEEEKIFLTIKAPDALISALNKVIIKTDPATGKELEREIFLDGGVCLKRYPASVAFFPEAESGNRSFELLFSKDIINSGEVKVRLLDTKSGSILIDEMRNSAQRLVAYILATVKLTKKIRIVIED